MRLKAFMYYIANRGPISPEYMRTLDPSMMDEDLSLYADIDAAHGFYENFASDYEKQFNPTEIEKYQNLLETKVELLDWGVFNFDRCDPMRLDVVNSSAAIKIGISPRNQFDFHMSCIKNQNFDCLEEFEYSTINLSNFDYGVINRMFHKVWDSNDIWAGSNLGFYRHPVKVYINNERDNLNEGDLHLIAMLRKEEIKYPVQLIFYNEVDPVDINNFRL